MSVIVLLCCSRYGIFDGGKDLLFGDPFFGGNHADMLEKRPFYVAHKSSCV